MDFNKLEASFNRAGYDYKRIEKHVVKSVQNSMDEEGDILPPWFKYPEFHPRKIFWRMGTGEDYITIFDMWRLSLTEEEMLGYLDRYPNPGEWNVFCITRHKKWMAKRHKNCSFCGSEINFKDTLCKFCQNNAEYSSCSAKNYMAVSDLLLSEIETK